MLGLIDDRFELTGLLGRSEYERVYRAYDRIGQVPALVRELTPQFFLDSESLEFFLRECEQIINSGQRGLVAPHSVRQADDGRIFLIGEYVDGISLRRLLDFLAAEGEACSPAAALSIGAQIGTALATAHHLVDDRTGEILPVLHLDVCPSNILLTADGTAKLKGFEITRARIRRGANQRPGRLAYLSPERIQGAYLDQRTDLYSLGVVVFEVLTNETPFAGETATALKKEILSNSREYPIFDQRRFPQGLRFLVQKAIALNPDDRQAGLKPFLAELSTVAAQIKGSGGRDELARIVKYTLQAVDSAPQPTDRISGPGEVVTTILLDRPLSETMPGAAETRRKPESEQKPVPAEPIEALASGALFAEPVPPVPPRRQRPREQSARPQKRFSGRVIAGTLVGLAIILLILDFAIGLTPLGRFFVSGDEPAPAGAQIASVPSGASIFINDQYRGRTPRKIKDWPDGVTAVRLEYRGFPVIETVIVIDNNKQPELPVFLFSRTVSVRSRPPGAEITINGRAVSPARAVGYPLRASDTLTIAVSKEGFSPPASLSLSCDGPVGEFDENQWLFEEDQSDGSLTITGVFLRKIMIASRPPGAEIFINADTIAAGTTNQSVILPFGIQQITLRHPSFLDHSFEIEVTEDSPDRYSPALGHYVRISAVDSALGSEDIGARIEWVRLGNRLIKGPDDRLQTPYSLSLEAANHEIKLVCGGYEDTIVVIGAVSDNVTVAMRSEKSVKTAGPEEKRSATSELREFKWVKFKVKRGGDPVSAATVIGYEEESGLQYEFGTTGKKGELLAKVPPGKFNFVAMVDGERSRARNKKIKAGKKTQSITLKFR